MIFILFLFFYMGTGGRKQEDKLTRRICFHALGGLEPFPVAFSYSVTTAQLLVAVHVSLKLQV